MVVKKIASRTIVAKGNNFLARYCNFYIAGFRTSYYGKSQTQNFLYQVLDSKYHTCLLAYMHSCIIVYLPTCTVQWPIVYLQIYILGYLHTNIFLYLHTFYQYTCTLANAHMCIQAYMQTCISEYFNSWTYTYFQFYPLENLENFMLVYFHTCIHACFHMVICAFL